MKVRRLDHYNLCASSDVIDKVKEFYIRVLGLTEGFRPSFGIGGFWLYIDEIPIVHLTTEEETLGFFGKRGRILFADFPFADLSDGNGAICSKKATGSIHHVALHCEGLGEFRARLEEEGICYQVGLVPQLNMTQLFFYDPAGVCVELNFTDEE